MGRIARLGLTFVLASLAVPAIASASTYYAAPGANGTLAECQNPAGPTFCSIGTAAGGAGVTAADTAVILPGNYSDTAGDLEGDNNANAHNVQIAAGNVHGTPGPQRPVISLNDSDVDFGAFFVATGNTLSDVEIVTAVNRTNLTEIGGTVDRVIARSTDDGADTIVCAHQGGAIKDSVCIAAGSNATALGVSCACGAFSTQNLTVRNVNALGIGTGTFGLNYAIFNSNQSWLISVKNTIARGLTSDIRASAKLFGGMCPTAVTITVDHSNFFTSSTANDAACGAAGSVVNGGNNVMGGVVLQADNVHQDPGSAGTINLGTADAANGTQDIDGQLRTLPGLGVPDIGADELAAATTATVACDPNPVVVTLATTCTATVSAADAETLNGTVSFTSNGAGTFSNGGTCSITGNAPQQQCQVTYTPSGLGAHQITASYGGNGFHDGDQGTTSVTAVKGTTTTAVSCAPASLLVNTVTVCSASVAGGAGGPSGDVSFTSDAAGAFSAGFCTLSGGQCQVSYTPSAVGPHQVTAAYGGDTNNDPSQATTAVTANGPPAGVTPGTTAKKKCKKKKRAASAAKKKCKKKKRR